MRRASSFAGTIRQKLILFSVLLLIFSGTAYSKHLISQARTNSEAQKAAVNIKVKEESIKQKLQTKKKVLTEPDQNKPEPVVSLATENITAERKTVALSGNAEFRRFMSMILRNADEGQVMSIKDGKLAWMPLTETKSPAQTRNAAPVQINYRGSSVDSGGSNRSSGGGGGGGGGGTQPPKFPVDHNHESGDQAGTLSVGAIASGILPQVRGGTAFNSYTVGDLLLGLTGSTLGKLPIGVAGEVLAVSGSTAAWKNSVLLTRTAYDERYVNTSGDTMTGALTLNLSSGYLGLKILQTASGNYIHSEKTLSSSGGLIVEGTISGSLITQNGGGNNYFMGNVGIGTTSPTAKLEVVGSMSGRSLQIAGNQNVSGALLVLGNITNRGTSSGNIIHAEKSLSSSGTLVWEGSASGASLNLAGGNITVSRSGAVVFNENGNNVDFRIEGDSDANLFFVDASTGRVGIGTTSPGANLDVIGAGRFNGLSAVAGSSIPNNGVIYGNTIYSDSYTGYTTNDVAFTNPGKTTFTGNVGIGTTTPLAKLDVVGSMSGRSLQIAGNQNISGSLLVLGTVTYRGTLSGNYIHAEKGLSSSGGLIVEGTISGSLLTQNGGGNNYFMGNVGIGTTTPGAKLDVTGGGINVNSNSGEATVKLTSYSNTPGWAAMRLYSARGTQASPSPLQSGDSIGTIIFDALEPQWNTFLASAQIYAAVDGAAGSNRLPGSLAFYTSDGNSAVQVRLTIKGSGNVGIGTTSPTAKLEVVGSMSGRSLQIAGNENISGSLLVLGTVTYRGTLSGNIIHAEKGLSSSGGLIVEGTISGSLITQNGGGNNYFMGNVGIGTTAPSDLLSINGAANAQWISLQYAGGEYVKFGQGFSGYGMYAGSVYGASEGAGFGINGGSPSIVSAGSIGLAGTNSWSYISGNVANNTTPILQIINPYAAKPGFTIKAAASQSAHLF